MKFSVPTQELVYALSIVTRAIPARPSNPILESVLVQASGSVVTLTASDGSLTIRTTANAIVDEDGEAAIPGRLLTDLTRRLPGDTTDFQSDGQKCAVKSGRSKTSLTVRPAQDYPDCPEVTGKRTITMPCGVVKSMISRTAFALSTDPARILLTGLDFVVRDGTVDVVALDGFRMAKATESGAYYGAYNAIIPSVTAGELARVLPSDDSDCVLTFTDGHMSAEFNGVSVRSVLLSGDYPDYTKLVPDSFSTRTFVRRSVMQSAIDRTGLMASNGRNNLIRMSVAEHEVSLSANAETGEIHETVDADTDGGALAIAFNAKYLTDIFKALTADDVVMSFNSPVKPVIVTARDDKSSLYLVLPVRTA